MFILLLSILSLTNEYQPSKTIVVDRVEVNHYYTPDSDTALSQIILWRWSNRYKRFEVAQWGRLQDARSWYRGYNKMFYWTDECGVEHKVKAKSFIHTRGCDPEIEDKKLLPTKERRPYLPLSTP